MTRTFLWWWSITENPELAPHEGIANQARVLSSKPRGEVPLEQQALFGASDREYACLGLSPWRPKPPSSLPVTAVYPTCHWEMLKLFLLSESRAVRTWSGVGLCVARKSSLSTGFDFAGDHGVDVGLQQAWLFCLCFLGWLEEGSSLENRWVCKILGCHISIWKTWAAGGHPLRVLSKEVRYFQLYIWMITKMWHLISQSELIWHANISSPCTFFWLPACDEADASESIILTNANQIGTWF